MLDSDDAAKIARAWIAAQANLQPTAWPRGTYGNFGPPDDYFVYAIIANDGGQRVGGCRHIAVHRRTGAVHDLGVLGE